MAQDLQKTNGAKQQPMIMQYLEQHKSQIAAALPKHLSPDRMARLCATTIRRQPELLECSPISLFGAIIGISQLGLEPDSSLGFIYMLPFKNKKTGTKEVNVIIGYRGFMELALRSGKIAKIVARAVYQGDKFSYGFGLNETLDHTPQNQTNRLIFVYVIATYTDPAIKPMFDVMSREEVETHRARSMAKDFGPWKSDYDAMAKKTVCRRASKYWPLSPELSASVAMDEEADRGEQDNARMFDGDFSILTPDQSAAPEKPASRAKGLAKKLANAPKDDPEGVGREPADKPAKPKKKGGGGAKAATKDETQSPPPEDRPEPPVVKATENPDPAAEPEKASGAPTEDEAWEMLNAATTMEQIYECMSISDVVSHEGMQKWKALLKKTHDAIKAKAN